MKMECLKMLRLVTLLVLGLFPMAFATGCGGAATKADSAATTAATPDAAPEAAQSKCESMVVVRFSWQPH